MDGHDERRSTAPAPALQRPADAADALQALQDVEYIKQLLARNRRKLERAFPFLYIWGCYVLIGYVGMQFAGDQLPVWSIWYWPIAGGVGGVLSFAVGIRQTRHAGVQTGGSYGWMFWLPFLAMGLTGYFMMWTGIVGLEYAAIFWFMLAGILYVCLGALLGKGPAVLGIWFIVLSAATRLFLLDYQYLILGLLGGGSIVAAGGLLHWRRRKRTHG